MELTNEGVQRFVGGQVAACISAVHAFVGEITSIQTHHRFLIIKLRWAADLQGYPVTRWVKSEETDFLRSILLSEIGENKGRVVILDTNTYETIVLLPPNDPELLDPVKEGILLATSLA